MPTFFINGAELSKSIQTFYKTVIESSSDKESDDDSELMTTATMLLHEHTLRYRGSVKGRDVYARVCSYRQCWASKCRGL
jgi:hypothetical protein